MHTPETEKPQEQKPFAASLGTIPGILLIPVLLLGACFAIPYAFVLRWKRQHRRRFCRGALRNDWRFGESFTHAKKADEVLPE
jgi:hypothetical protein